MQTTSGAYVAGAVGAKAGFGLFRMMSRYRATILWTLAVVILAQSSTLLTVTALLLVTAGTIAPYVIEKNGHRWPWWAAVFPSGDLARRRYQRESKKGSQVLAAVGLLPEDGRTACRVYRDRKSGTMAVTFRAADPRHTPDRVEQAAEDGKHMLGFAYAVVSMPETGIYRIEWSNSAPADPLAEPVLWSGNQSTDLAAIPTGLTERGETVTLAVNGTHTLIVGRTGSGKGSVLWSTVLGCLPAILDGTVEFWGIDLKGGVEFGLGERLFARLAETPDDALALLRDAQAAMNDRLAWMRSTGSRKHQPEPGQPQIVVVIDEAGALKNVLAKKDADEADRLLRDLLTKGRAPAVTVIAALQDPRKDALPTRDLFPTAVGLRLANADESRMLLGTTAHENGARCEDISASHPGIGYLVTNDGDQVQRARFCWVPDEVLGQMPQAPASVVYRRGAQEEGEKEQAK